MGDIEKLDSRYRDFDSNFLAVYEPPIVDDGGIVLEVHDHPASFLRGIKTSVHLVAYPEYYIIDVETGPEFSVSALAATINNKDNSQPYDQEYAEEVVEKTEVTLDFDEGFKEQSVVYTVSKNDSLKNASIRYSDGLATFRIPIYADGKLLELMFRDMWSRSEAYNLYSQGIDASDFAQKLFGHGRYLAATAEEMFSGKIES